ncbi:taurine ABC transporter permease [Rhodovibrio sodomensis]|uniref:Taurine ABC transporter permease n=1 Tax=Rhodovibrio sodomensis TaxID=1088 RepID=A0ABS1DL44_9PROT|nr:taurine ABC transporter permease [Rhodovibrio sodomensis]
MTVEANHKQAGRGIARVLMNIGRRRRPTTEVYGQPGAGRSSLISFATAFVLLLVWWLVTNAELVKPLFLPPPEMVFDKFVEVSSEGFNNATLFEHALQSIMRVFAAFALACVTAIPIGIGMGVNKLMRGLFDPPIEFYRPIPPLAYLPLIIIWFGIGETSKILLIYLGIFAPLALSARAGVRSASIEQIHVAYSFGASRWQVLKHVVFKAALPEILTGMRIAIGFGWTVLVAAEMVAATSGLGYMVLSASEFLNTSVVILGIIVIGFLAYMFDMIMRFIEGKLVPWKGRA